jgi:hypothetical protein
MPVRYHYAPHMDPDKPNTEGMKKEGSVRGQWDFKMGPMCS